MTSRVDVAGGASRGWWRAALGIALGLSLLYAAPDLRVAFSGPYVVQNDARQHVFWMRRFGDPALFGDDLIATYFGAVAPAGYIALYRIGAAAGIDPILFGKLVPLVLAPIAAAYAFALGTRMLRHPAAAFLASVLLTQHLWLTDELASATPHAFAVPLLVAFLYHLATRSTPGCAVTLALQGLFYPQVLLVSCGTLVLWLVRLERGRLRLTRDRLDWRLAGVSLAAAALGLLPFALASKRFGPAITAEEARVLPEFFRGGRARFFDRDAWEFWMVAHRSGLMAKFFSASGPFIYAAIPMLAGLLLPFLVLARRRFPLAASVTSEAGLLARLGLASVALFAGAHALLFRLHLPSRYSMFSARIIFALAGGMALTILGSAAARRLWRPGPAAAWLRWGLGAAGAALAVAFLAAPLFQTPGGAYVVGEDPALYRFFADQPAHVRIASLSPEADNLPTFARRSVLVSRLHAVPYQVGYYSQIRRRATDLIRAEYARDPGELRAFLEAYGVDYLVLDRWSFRERYLTLDSWVRQYRPLVERLGHALARGERPALEELAGDCTKLETERTIVVDAGCLLGRGAAAAARGRRD